MIVLLSFFGYAEQVRLLMYIARTDPVSGGLASTGCSARRYRPAGKHKATTYSPGTLVGVSNSSSYSTTDVTWPRTVARYIWDISGAISSVIFIITIADVLISVTFSMSIIAVTMKFCVGTVYSLKCVRPIGYWKAKTYIKLNFIWTLFSGQRN